MMRRYHNEATGCDMVPIIARWQVEVDGVVLGEVRGFDPAGWAVHERQRDGTSRCLALGICSADAAALVLVERHRSARRRGWRRRR